MTASSTTSRRQPEQIRAFRDTWKDGIHSYLAYLRDRLTVARELLADTGHVFVQIGDENVHLVRSLLDEVFGSENFISLITFRKTERRDRRLPCRHDGLSRLVREGQVAGEVSPLCTAPRRWASMMEPPTATLRSDGSDGR